MLPGRFKIDRDFLKLWTGQAVSQFGSRITREGLPLTAVLVLGASPRQMGILSGAGAAAILLFGLFAGAWADRIRRRPILIATDLGRGLLLATIPLAAILHQLSMGQLYCIAALTGIMTVSFDVSYQAYLPHLVDESQLVEGNSRMALTESLAEVAGPGITGLLVQWITAPLAILFDALSFFASALSIATISRREPPPSPALASHIGQEISAGLRFAWNQPLLKALLRRSATGAFFLGFISSLYIVFAIRVLGLNAALLGAVISIGGISSLCGALVAARLSRRFGAGRTLIASALVSGIAVLLMPLAPRPSRALRRVPLPLAVARYGVGRVQHQRTHAAAAGHTRATARPRQLRHAPRVSRNPSARCADRRNARGVPRNPHHDVDRGRRVPALVPLADLLSAPRRYRVTIASGRTGAPVAPRIFIGTPMNRNSVTPAAASSSRFRHSMM